MKTDDTKSLGDRVLEYIEANGHWPALYVAKDVKQRLVDALPEAETVPGALSMEVIVVDAIEPGHIAVGPPPGRRSTEPPWNRVNGLVVKDFAASSGDGGE